MSLYEQFKDDKSCSVAMNLYTGEVLALVSTPAYDNNDFIMGLSSEQWTALNEDENKPMYNRFRQVYSKSCIGRNQEKVVNDPNGTGYAAHGEDTVERPILIISMVEDVKGRGGSGYVVKKDNQVLEEWFNDN